MIAQLVMRWSTYIALWRISQLSIDTHNGTQIVEC